jgi:antitoxin HicB
MAKNEVKKRGNEEDIEYYMGLPYSILLHQIEDSGEKFWIAEVPELPGCKSHGSTVDEAAQRVEEAKKDWILDSLEKGESIPTPVERDRFNGRILVRTSRSLHRALSLMSDMEKLSLNQLIVTILAKEVGRLEVLNRVEDKLDKVLGHVPFRQKPESSKVSFHTGVTCPE